MSLPIPPKGVVVAIEEADKPYLPRFTPALGGVPSKVFAGNIDTLTEFTMKLEKAGIGAVITTRLDILRKLLPIDAAAKASINNYAGSIIRHRTVDYLIVHPMKQLVSRSFGDFLNRRYVSKIVKPHHWRQTSKFNWKVLDNETVFNEAVEFLSSCDLIGTDIETVKDNAAITLSGYCGVRLSDNTSMAYVIPMRSMEAVRWMRKLNDLSVPKVLQNGKYDIAYFCRYSAPLVGYYYDTVNMLHSWYSELPKDLGSVSALLIRDSMYWKDLSATGDAMEYMRYNALDTWGTVESAITWMLEAPDWAKNNYKMEFPQVPAAHLCEMQGMKRNQKQLEEQNEKSVVVQDKLLQQLQAMVGDERFNPSSPKHVLNLVRILGYKQATSSDEKTLVEAATKSPLIDLFVSKILSYRGERKLTSTYIPVGSAAKEFKGRYLYSLNPHGTETGRYASKGHHFWCGESIQTAPSDPSEDSGADFKSTLEADEGFEFHEFDFSQAEDRGVAYNSGDKNLLHIFDSGVDSHSYKAAMFFGTPYEEIYDPESGKVLRKDIRQLGKRINHGANYNMGAKVLLQTMGSVQVAKAQNLLGLPANWPPIKVCEHLLFLYERAFPMVKGKYYASIKAQVRTTRKLVGATGWTRYCFGNPDKNKPDLNSYVAHVTQSLNAMILNKSFLKVFNNLAFLPEFKLTGQIHDSILCQIKIGHDHLAERVKELMNIPTPVTDCSGVTRTLIVPVDHKKLGKLWRG